MYPVGYIVQHFIMNPEEWEVEKYFSIVNSFVNVITIKLRIVIWNVYIFGLV